MSVIEGVIRREGLTLERSAQVIYVDPSATALQTAIDAAVDDAGDVIIVESGSHTVTETVAFNKKGITVIAADLYSPYARGERFTIRADAAFTDGPVATITRPCTLIGLGFWGREATGASVAMNFGTGGFNSGGWSQLKRCWFPNHGEIQRALDLSSVDRVTIEECVFDGSNNGALTSGTKELTIGVRLTQAHNCHLIENEFINALTAIDAALIAPKTDPVHGNVGCTIRENVMLGVPATHFFLDVEDTAAVRPQKIHVIGNQLGVAVASEAYKLGGAAQANLTSLVTAGLQFSDNHYAE